MDTLTRTENARESAEETDSGHRQRTEHEYIQGGVERGCRREVSEGAVTADSEARGTI